MWNVNAIPDAEPASAKAARGIVEVSVDAESIPVQVVISDGWREVAGNPMSLAAAIQEATRSARGTQLSRQIERVDWDRLRSGAIDSGDIWQPTQGAATTKPAQPLTSFMAVIRETTATLISIAGAEYSNTRGQNDVRAYVSGTMKLRAIDFTNAILDEPASIVSKSVTLAVREAFNAAKLARDDALVDAMAQLKRL